MRVKTIRALLPSTILLALSACEPPPIPMSDVADVPRTDAPTDTATDSGAQCSMDEQCDDNLFCNGTERCVSGRCLSGVAPCDDRRTCSTRTCDEDTDTCTRNRNDLMCSDGNSCNGIERCLPGGPGSDPVTGCTPPSGSLPCDDGNPCTVDGCDMTLGCVHAPRDLDGDGYIEFTCTVTGRPDGMGGNDCDDTNPDVFPGNPEVCNDGVDNNCDGQIDLQETTACMPRNDTCAAPQVLRTGLNVGSNVGLTNDFALSCNAGTFADSVFQFTLTETRDVSLTLAVNNVNAALSIVPANCNLPLNELRCVRGAATTPATVRVRSLAAGTYYVIAETGTTTRAFNLLYNTTAPTTPPAEDACPPMGGPDNSINIADNMPRTANFAASPALLENDVTLSCNSTANTPDAVYKLVLPQASDVTITATGGAGTTYLALRENACNTTTNDRRCISTTGSTTGTIQIRNVAAGTYWVLVENNMASSVAVRANVVPAAVGPTGDQCPGIVTPLNGAMATGVPFMPLLTDSDYGTSCGSVATPATTWKDAAFQFTLASTQDVLIRGGRSNDATGTGSVFMQVFRTCGDRTSAFQGCQSGNAQALATGGIQRRLAGLAAGTYTVVLESRAMDPGDLQAQVTTSDPTMRPANETCPGQTIPTDGTPTTITWGSSGTAGAVGVQPDLGTRCGAVAAGAGSLSFRDAVLGFDVTATSDAEISVTQGDSAVNFEVRRTCEDSASIVGQCVSIPSNAVGATGRRLLDLAPGRYFIVVDTAAGAPTMPTTVSVRTSLSSTRSAAETCPGQMIPTDNTPVPVTWGTLGMAGSIGRGSDLGTACGSGTAPANYRDAVLMINVPQLADLDLTINNQGTSIFYDLRPVCTDRAVTALSCRALASSATMPATHRIRLLPPGMYALVLETNAPMPAMPTLVSANLLPASATYTASDNPAGVSFMDVCPSGMRVLTSIDDAIATVAYSSIPFPVKFYDTTGSTNLSISSNGYIAFGTLTTPPAIASLPSLGEPNLFAAAYNRDLATSVDGVCYGVTGSAPNRKFVVQWNNARDKSATGSALDFQIVINEAAANQRNVIDLIYQRIMNPGTAPVVGTENEDATLFTRVTGAFTGPRIVRLTPN